VNIKKVLIANRGEIALRVIRTLREMGIRSVAVFSDADRMELHVRSADEAYPIGPPAPSESYLRGDKIIEVALEAGCQAVHPGYGFLSENADFARAVEEAGLIFIGPTADSIARAGDKVVARRTMLAAGVPVIPGSDGPVGDPDELAGIAARIGFPVALKAVGGGGGKGIRVVYEEGELRAAFERASSEAASAFGNAAMYVEKFLVAPRHIEVQVFADNHGNTVHMGERECSIQRRHQKLLEETPSPFVDDDLRARMGAAAVAAAKAVNYRNAGTVEFLVDAEKNFYFLEINTRIQVEHPITEMVYGIDLVRLQVRAAQGRELFFKQEQLVPSGHAIEVRLTAENPFTSFMPEAGVVRSVRMPEGPGVRIDASLYPGQEIKLFYDPMIGKIITHGYDREDSTARMIRALMELRLVGVRTCAPLLLMVLQDERFRKGECDTSFLEKYVSEPDWRQLPDFGGVPADIPAVITAVLYAHEQKGAGKAVVDQGDGESGRKGNPWLEAGRNRWIR
jgi:acetyl-CoA carboxylase biotin carboxylase subunit